MADPMTLAVVGMTAAAVGGGISAYGSYQSGQAEASKYKYQSGVAQINQQLKLQDAEYARDVGEVEAQQSGLRTRANVGRIRAIQGGSNLDVNSGSAAMVRKSEIDIGQENQAIIRANAARRAYGFEVEAMNQGTQSKLYDMASSQSSTAGNIKATGTLISTAGNVASKWYTMGSNFGSSDGSTTNPWSPGGPGDAGSWA